MILQVQDISKRLGNFRLEHVSFELPEGYIMGLIGPNGAGKTTLIHIILGLYQPDAGTVLIGGKDYSNAEQEIKEQIGCVLLDELFEGALTLKQNADGYGAYYTRYDPNTADHYMERFALRQTARYAELSRGEKLKFQLAFALSHDANLLVLDEPAGNFDPEFRGQFLETLKEFIADGKRSVILSTHLTDDLDRMADYITYLEQGKMILSDDIESVRESYRLVAGEAYKIRLLPKEDVICTEQGEYGARALVRHHRRRIYDKELTVLVPSIEELMYFMTKRGKQE